MKGEGMNFRILGSLGIIVAVFAFATNGYARDQIRVVGSSTVFPFVTAAAEEAGRTFRMKTPVVESTGTGGGMKLFCSGIGVDHPDITNASRPIKQSEVDLCAKNGVTDVTEIKIGYDGIVVAGSKEGKLFNLSKRELFLALAKRVPVASGFIDNPYTHWNQINSTFPATKIEVLGPPPTSGTRDAFVELVMEEAAKKFSIIAKLPADEFKTIAHSIREDGAYIEAGENDNLIVQKLRNNPDAVGIFGFSFLDNNTDSLRGMPIDGIEPTFDNIANNEYQLSRSLFIYVKNQHSTIPGLMQFVEWFGLIIKDPNSFLVDKGLIPLAAGEQSHRAIN
jgi:phosphate transport system substrate-binding protein